MFSYERRAHCLLRYTYAPHYPSWSIMQQPASGMLAEFTLVLQNMYITVSTAILLHMSLICVGQSRVDQS